MTDKGMAKKSFRDKELTQKAEKYYYGKYTVTLDWGEEFRRDMVTSAYLAGAKDNATQWHKIADGDLPQAHSTVLDENGDKVEYIGYGKWQEYSEYYERYVEADPPIAWCEIPIFEEVSE